MVFRASGQDLRERWPGQGGGVEFRTCGQGPVDDNEFRLAALAFSPIEREAGSQRLLFALRQRLLRDTPWVLRSLFRLDPPGSLPQCSLFLDIGFFRIFAPLRTVAETRVAFGRGGLHGTRVAFLRGGHRIGPYSRILPYLCSEHCF